MRDEDDITTINHAKAQATYSDYLLAQEEYSRKKAAAQARREAAPYLAGRNTASSLAARRDHLDTVRQLKTLLANPDISQEDRNTLERKLQDEEMALKFGGQAAS
jgi:predicted RNA binding protein with dsRBD fold (UPF0201 family)